jgi:hypothetical protein
MRAVKADLSWQVGSGHVVIYGVPGWQCGDCAEVYRTADDLGRSELIAAGGLASTGYREGAVFKFMRKAVGLRATDLAELLDVTPETISRWENDRHEIDRPAWLAVEGLVRDALERKDTTRRRLLALNERRAHKEPLRLDFASDARGC